jgi:cell division protein FtsB
MDPRRQTPDGSSSADARRRRMRRGGLVALAAGIALGLPAANVGAQSVEQLNSQISSAQSQAQSLGAEIDAKTSQAAAR